MVRLYEIGLEMTLETREEVGVAAIDSRKDSGK